ncbi:hypothetical protein [Staphylococcus sp. NAM3COL9]|uniref:hypothetical protein n=1 Tax=Staphylococcus sp. NAM3COL9 TaxID=1667172 RepID=UPI00070B3604|nr:hypothetical protein [Staphylococcus sp. NAM3COL9]KRG08131.1 membrane protein [Staphylococcus sp. NAM3COL9]
MLYLVIIVAILLLASGIHQYFNVDKNLKIPSITYFAIGFVLYIVAILLYRTELLDSSTIIHEILLTTIFGLIIFWINSHRNKTSDTSYYTIIIVILTIVLAMLPLTPTLIISLQMMYIVRFIFSVILLIVGVFVLYKRIKGKVSESFPLLYLMAFIYWIAIAYWF